MDGVGRVEGAGISGQHESGKFFYLFVDGGARGAFGGRDCGAGLGERQFPAAQAD